MYQLIISNHLEKKDSPILLLYELSTTLIKKKSKKRSSVFSVFLSQVERASPPSFLTKFKERNLALRCDSDRMRKRQLKELGGGSEVPTQCRLGEPRHSLLLSPSPHETKNRKLETIKPCLKEVRSPLSAGEENLDKVH